MATHARITPALLSATGQRASLLREGLGRQPGPVTQAIRAMRAAEPLPPADAAIEAIREGLIRYFVVENGADRQRVRELRRRIADRIEADLAFLDALDGDPDFEPSLAAPEPYSWQRGGRWAQGGTDDRENAECADCDGDPIMVIPALIGRCA